MRRRCKKIGRGKAVVGLLLCAVKARIIRDDYGRSDTGNRGDYVLRAFE